MNDRLSKIYTHAYRLTGICEVGFIFLVPPKGHPVYTLTNIKKEPYVHSPKKQMQTLLHWLTGFGAEGLGILVLQEDVWASCNLS